MEKEKMREIKLPPVLKKGKRQILSSGQEV